MSEKDFLVKAEKENKESSIRVDTRSTEVKTSYTNFKKAL